MGKDLVFLLLLTFACAKKTVIEKSEGIFILNEKNYDKAVKEFDYLLVYFYAPWLVIAAFFDQYPHHHCSDSQVRPLQGSGTGVCEGGATA